MSQLQVLFKLQETVTNKCRLRLLARRITLTLVDDAFNVVECSVLPAVLL